MANNPITQKHEHETWQINRDGDGLPYCKACGERVAYDYSDVFPSAWDGYANSGSLHECGICGSAVVSTDTHIDWHNAQRDDLRKKGI